MSADPKAPEPGRERLARLTMEFIDGYVPGPLRKHAVPALDDLVRAYQEDARRDGAEAVNAEPPATPEPAAPMPRVSGLSESALSVLMQAVIEKEQFDDCGGLHIPAAELRSLVDEVRGGRAKVAELEARIAEQLRALLASGAAVENQATARALAAEAALARANEALSAARFQAFNEALDVLVSEHIDGTEEEMRAIGARLRELRDAARAQGSAAQKPEGPDAL